MGYVDHISVHIFSMFLYALEMNCYCFNWLDELFSFSYLGASTYFNLAFTDSCFSHIPGYFDRHNQFPFDHKALLP